MNQGVYLNFSFFRCVHLGFTFEFIKKLGSASIMVKEELDNLLEARFIKFMETIEWVYPIVLALKKNGKLRVCVNYKTLNKITKKDRYPLPFCEEILEEITRHNIENG